MRAADLFIGNPICVHCEDRHPIGFDCVEHGRLEAERLRNIQMVKFEPRKLLRTENALQGRN